MFPSLQAVTQHKQDKHGASQASEVLIKTPFQCSICMKRFTSATGAATHIMGKHSNVLSSIDGSPLETTKFIQATDISDSKTVNFYQHHAPKLEGTSLLESNHSSQCRTHLPPSQGQPYISKLLDKINQPCVVADPYYLNVEHSFLPTRQRGTKRHLETEQFLSQPQHSQSSYKNLHMSACNTLMPIEWATHSSFLHTPLPMVSPDIKWQTSVFQ